MNAPETLKPAADPINIAHEVLMKSDEAICVNEVARAIFGGDNPKKSDLRDARRMLKELADLGMIEMEPRAGGVPFYRLIAAPSCVVTHNPHTGTPRNPLDIESDPEGLLIVKDGEPLKAYQAEERILTPGAQAERDQFKSEYGRDGNCSCHISPPCASCMHPENPLQQDEDESCWMAAGDSEGGETDAPAAINDTPKFGHGLSCGACHDGCAGEQCKVERDSPPIDTQREEFTLLSLLADIRAAAGDPDGRLMQDELVQHIAGVVKERDDLRERLDAQINQWQSDTGRLAADLREAMESRSRAINEADRLRAELATERQAREALQEQSGVIQAAGYVLKAPKRPLRRFGKEEAAKSAAMAAARVSGRGEVFALVPVGAARRGAEWREV